MSVKTLLLGTLIVLASSVSSVLAGDIDSQYQTSGLTAAVPLMDDELDSLRGGIGTTTIIIEGRTITVVDIGITPVGFDVEKNAFVSPGAGKVVFTHLSTTGP